MSNVTRLPTAATSYYTVCKAGDRFDVVLVTPCGRRNIKTRLYRLCEEQYAHDVGREIAKDMKRPFNFRGAVQ